MSDKSSEVSMHSVNDGGPAFPGDQDSGCKGGGSEGMTLRDWFAGQALLGMTTNVNNTGACLTDFALFAYEQADAMIAARGQHD